jgi:nucleoside-diphosphate-sugar epimerase
VSPIVRPSGRTVVVTGRGGIIGTHVCERLVLAGDYVICVDNFRRSTTGNVAHLLDVGMFQLVVGDVREKLEIPEFVEHVDEVWHLASIVGPEFCARNPHETVDVAYEGTRRMLEFAQRHGARFLLASSSEIYGRATVHPTPESYGGNLNPVGPRGPYAEGKRIGETLTSIADVDGRIVRLFNVYGPRMQPDDGRVVPTFIRNAFAGVPLPVFGNEHTRSVTYVADVVEGMLAVMRMGLLDAKTPVNLGSPVEHTIREVAEVVLELTESDAGIAEGLEPPPAYVGEPEFRGPELGFARSLGWEPKVTLREGLAMTIAAWPARVAFSKHERRGEMAVTARFKVSRLSPWSGTDVVDGVMVARESGVSASGEVELTPDYAQGRNAEWAAATPAGVIRMTITNEAALQQFRDGRPFKVTFESEDE